MEANAKQSKEREGTVSALNAAIEVLSLAKEASSIAPANAVFGSVSIVLAMIRVGSPLFLANGVRTEALLGRDGQPGGLHRTWAGLR